MSCGMRRKALIASLTVGCFLVVTGFLLGYVVFPAAVRLRIINAVQLTRGSDAYQRYLKAPFPIQLKVYVFNVTNPAEVHSGEESPFLQEIGPYVYDIYKEKIEVQEDFESDTLIFYQKNKYYFNRDLSVGEEDDPILVLNAPLLGMIDKTRKSSPAILAFLNSVLPEIFSSSATTPGMRGQQQNFNVFVPTTVGGIMFHGVQIKCSRKGFFNGFLKNLVCTQIGYQTPESLRKWSEGDDFEEGDYLFSFFHHKNNTREGPIRVRRGLKDLQAMGQVVSWKDKDVMTAWGPPPPAESPCNVIEGTDSSVIAPFLDEKSVVKVFQPEMCRSLSASFEKALEYRGIPAMRYVADIHLFGSPKESPSNWCYYPMGNEESRDRYWATTYPGVQDISECLGSPLIVSYPHFYSASHKYLEYARGLHPQKEKHETFIDVETMTATPMRAAKRLQFNMPLKRTYGITALRNVSEGLFPIMWVEESMSLDQKYTDLINESLFDVVFLLTVIQWGTIALGLSIVIVILIASRGRLNGSAANAEEKKMKEANQLPTYEMSKEDVLPGRLDNVRLGGKEWHLTTLPHVKH